MKILIFICLFELNLTLLFPNIGLGITQQAENVEFYSDTIEIGWSRIINSPCNSINITSLTTHNPCYYRSSGKQADIDRYNRHSLNLHYLREKCHIKWDKLLAEINSESVVPNKRSKRSLLATVLGVTSILANLVTATSAIHQFFHPSDPLVQIKENNIRIGTIVEHTVDNINILNKKLCSTIDIIHQNRFEFLIDEFVNSYLKSVDTEISHLCVGQLPHSLKFHNDILEVCKMANVNNLEFCFKALQTGIIDFKFNGLQIDGNTLNIFIKLRLPLKDINQNYNKAYSVINNGFYRKNNFFKMNIPNTFLVVGNESFTVDSAKCTSNLQICAINSLTKNNCVGSLFTNNIENCSIEQTYADNFCVISKLSNGYLLTIKRGLFIPSNKLNGENLNLNQANLYLNHSGTLYCNENTYNLVGNPILISTVKYIPSIIVPQQSNYSDLFMYNTIYANNQLKINNTLTDLISSNDNIAIGSLQTPTILIIVISNFIFVIITFFLLFGIYRQCKIKYGKKYNLQSGNMHRRFTKGCDTVSIIE